MKRQSLARCTLRPLLLLSPWLLGSCAATPDPVAFENRVFYEREAGSDVDLRQLLEKDYDPLDGESHGGGVHDGVEILRGVARLSRPSDWVIRRGSIQPEGRFIEYVSPRQIIFSVYERLESPKERWSVLLDRYTADTEAQGGQLLGKAVPFATWDSQARAFDVRRAVPAGKEPLVSYSREYLARSEHRVIVIQIVRPREEYAEAEDELIRVMTTFSVL